MYILMPRLFKECWIYNTVLVLAVTEDGCESDRYSHFIVKNYLYCLMTEKSTELEWINPKICMDSQKTLNSQRNLKKKEQS